MKYQHFGDFVDSFDQYGQRLATTVKPFLQTKRQTYNQLQAKVYQSAQFLKDQGLTKGDRVLVIAANCPQWQELFLGCQLLGIILTPVDARSSLQMTLNFAKQVSPKMVFRGKFLVPNLDKHFKAHILDDYDSTLNEYPAQRPNVKLTGQETAVIIFTSGTTAEPKGVMLSQQNILSNVEAVSKAIDINPDWRILSILPLSHSYELTVECCMMSRGVAIFYLPKIAPLAIVKGLNEYKITALLSVPQLLALLRQRILQTADAEGQGQTLRRALRIALKLPIPIRRIIFSKVHKKLGGHLSIVVTGGAPIPTEVGLFWESLGVRALQGYGLTETSPILTVNRLHDKFRDSQGRALDGVELKIADDGELLAKGPNIYQGYWNNPEKTKETFTKDGWFRTGDMGKIDADGWLKLSGRAKFMIVLPSGMNVFPEDVEAVAEKHSTIKEVCVVGRRQADGEQVFAAIVSDKSDKAIKKAISEINDQLEDFQRISDWARWPDKQFPRTLLLKIDRKNVQAWVNQETGRTAVVSNTANVDPLIGMLRQVLDNPIKQIEETDKLSSLGIDSLRRLAVVSMIEDQLGAVIPEMNINKHTSVDDLRNMIKSSSQHKSDAKRTSWQYNQLVRFVGNILRETVVRGILRLITTTKVIGRNNLSSLNEPAIYIFNHIDNLDGATAVQSLPWRIRRKIAVAQADDFLKEHRYIRFWARLLFAAFNFSRFNNVMPGLEYSVDRLENGWNVLMAPEGSVSEKNKMQPFKSGIGLLAVETGVPIVPIKIDGLFGTLPLHSKLPKKHSRVTVNIGQPITFDKNYTYDQATTELEKIMKQL